jgi:predicted metal-dependent RNase
MKPKPRNIILNHGEPQAIRALAESIKRKASYLGLPSDIRVYTPSILDSLMLTGSV